MQYGLQTHFGDPIGPELCGDLRALRFTWARIDAQNSSQQTMLAMIDESTQAGLTPLVIVADEARLAALPSGIDAEWTNEPDGDIAPAAYRVGLDGACQVAQARGIRLWAPAISNLDHDSLAWLNAVRDAGGGWPAELHGISVHRYGDGTFETPHTGFSSRTAEVNWLKAACAGLPYLVSEFGYPTVDGLTEAQQAERITQEWHFWAEEGAEVAILFQVNDGPDNTREHRYGIRRFDGSWKPSADTVPRQQTEGDMPQATFVLSRRDLIPHPSRPGYFTCRYPKGRNTVLSIQPGGSFDTRSPGTTGPWETLRDDGTRAVFEDVEDGVYAIPLVD